MKTAMKFVCFLLAILIFSAAAFAEDCYVRLAIKGTNVNLRPGPRVAGSVVAQTNTGVVFIAEKWPIVLTDDDSLWYKIVLAADAKTDEISMLSEWNSRFLNNVAYVRADFAAVSPLARGDMEKIMATPVGIGYSFDIDPHSGEFELITENNFRFFAAYECSILGDTDIYDENFINDEDAKVIGRYKSGDRVRLLGTNSDETIYKVMDPTFKRLPGYIDADMVDQNRSPVDEYFNFSAHKSFCELYIGANIGEIVRKWGATEIERKMVDVFDQGDYELLTSINTPGMSAYITELPGTLVYVMNFTTDRQGAGVGGIYVGIDWCDKDWVRKLLGEPHEIYDNSWLWTSEFQSVWIHFENGLVKSIDLEHRWAD